MTTKKASPPQVTASDLLSLRVRAYVWNCGALSNPDDSMFSYDGFMLLPSVRAALDRGVARWDVTALALASDILNARAPHPALLDWAHKLTLGDSPKFLAGAA